jgi:hypothetical protein
VLSLGRAIAIPLAFVFMACGGDGHCLKRLEAAVERECATVSKAKCQSLRRGMLEEFKKWEAMTDEEQEKAKTACL